MRIDSHQHFWKYTRQDYSWIDEKMAVLKRHFLPQDLAPVLAEKNIDGSIAVQARQSLEETEWLLELADKNDIIKGVVGWIDLQSDGVEEQLEKYSQHKKLVGVRHVVQDEPDDNFILGEKIVRGISKLKKYGLTYDILIFENHLKAAIKFVSTFPNQKFVLDHIAKPKIKMKEMEPWNSNIRELAKFPNVMCKVSGMVTEADWSTWKEGDFKPYLDAVFEAFGTDRILFGSDWPVCTVAGSYSDIFSILDHYLMRFSSNEKEKIFGGNACEFYGIK